MTTTNKILTVKLRNGLTVLAKKTKFGINEVTFANNTQANIKQLLIEATGIKCYVIGFGSPCKYIVIN